MRLPLIVGQFFMAYGIIACILIFGFGSIVGTIMLVAAPILFFITKEHLVIDFTHNKYRYAIDVLGFDFGPWQDLPEIEYVSVFVAKYRNGSQGGEDDKGFRKLEVNLIYGRNRRMNVWVGTNKQAAFAAAEYIAENLNVRLLDATQKPFVWLDEK